MNNNHCFLAKGFKHFFWGCLLTFATHNIAFASDCENVSYVTTIPFHIKINFQDGFDGKAKTLSIENMDFTSSLVQPSTENCQLGMMVGGTNETTSDQLISMGQKISYLRGHIGQIQIETNIPKKNLIDKLKKINPPLPVTASFSFKFIANSKSEETAVINFNPSFIYQFEQPNKISSETKKTKPIGEHHITCNFYGYETETSDTNNLPESVNFVINCI